jgi:hypothetical protein
MHRQLKLELRADPRQKILGTATRKEKHDAERALVEMMVAYLGATKGKEPADEQ